MTALRVRPAGSLLQGSLPTGCAMCERGAKMVLFVTGVCHYKCFYCPISGEKRMSRDSWVNERRIPYAEGSDADLKALAEEARAMNARGTGMTGGDPMYDPERTLRYIRFLKAEFGPKHHIHLYTQIPFDAKWLPRLAEAGLDELRFHVPDEVWEDVDAHPAFARLYREAVALMRGGSGMEIGAEVPCIPGATEALWKLLRWCDAAGFRYVNVNEMEFSETNYANLLSRDIRILDDETSRAVASEDVAREVLRRHAEAGLAVAFHFCSSPFKDRVQLRERLRRRAERVARPFDEVTEDATLLRGVVECADPREVRNVLAREYDVPPRVTAIREGRLLVAPWALEPVAARLPWPCFLSEVYPTHDELEVERVPLAKEAGLPVGDAATPSGGPRRPAALRPGGW